MGISHLLAVHPDVGRTINAIEVQEYLPAVPCRGHTDCTPVATHGVRFVKDGISFLSPDERRDVLEGIGNVGIYRRAIAKHLPAGRHGNRLP